MCVNKSTKIKSVTVWQDLESGKRFLSLLDLDGELIQYELLGNGEHQLVVEMSSRNQHSEPE